MSKYKPGNVVIVDTNQAGTIWWMEGQEVCVLLTCGDIWYGFGTQIRLPKNREELDTCPRELGRFSNRNGSYGKKL